MGINKHSQVVGWSEMPGEGPVAFLHEGFTMIDLNTRLADPTWELLWANGINDRGQIVGIGRYNGEHVGFVLSPKSRQLPNSPQLCLAGNK